MREMVIVRLCVCLSAVCQSRPLYSGSRSLYYKGRNRHEIWRF